MGNVIRLYETRSKGDDDATPIADASTRIKELALEAARAAPTRAEAATREAEQNARVARAAREERLPIDQEFAVATAITAEMRAAIISGRIPEHTHAMRVVHGWREAFYGRRETTFAPYLTLYGPKGRGKTSAAAWLIANEVGGLYVSAEDFRLRFANRGRDKDNNAWIDRVLRARVVVLDDVGTEDGDPRASMFEFVNRRQGLHRAFTLMTSNLLSRDEFVARYDWRVVDRLEHVGKMVLCKGEDLRSKP